MADSVLESIGSHLEFLGYEVVKDPEKKAFLAKHATHANMRVREFGGGILFTALWGASDVAKSDTLGFLRSINALNEKAAVARFYTDHDANDLGFFIEAWQPNVYEKASFGGFMEVLGRDFQLLADDKSDIGKFLS